MGNCVWRELDFRTGSGSIRVWVNITATKAANVSIRLAESIIEGYSQALVKQGYNAE